MGHPSPLIDQHDHYPIELAVTCCNWGVNTAISDTPKYKDRTADKRPIGAQCTALFLLFIHGHIWSCWLTLICWSCRHQNSCLSWSSSYWLASTSKPVPWKEHIAFVNVHIFFDLPRVPPAVRFVGHESLPRFRKQGWLKELHCYTCSYVSVFLKIIQYQPFQLIYNAPVHIFDCMILNIHIYIYIYFVHIHLLAYTLEKGTTWKCWQHVFGGSKLFCSTWAFHRGHFML